MDVIVTARVPVEIKEQANDILKKIGANPTQLINAAYEYVLSQGELPQAHPQKVKKKQGLSQDEKEQLIKSIEATSFSIPESHWSEDTYKDLIARDRGADYETLA